MRSITSKIIYIIIVVSYLLARQGKQNLQRYVYSACITLSNSVHVEYFNSILFNSQSNYLFKDVYQGCFYGYIRFLLLVLAYFSIIQALSLAVGVDQVLNNETIYKQGQLILSYTALIILSYQAIVEDTKGYMPLLY